VVTLASEAFGLVLTKRVGIRKAVRVVSLLLAWGWWYDLHGKSPTTRHLAGDTERSQASWARDLGAFREAFPDEESPERLALRLAVVMRRQRELSMNDALGVAFSVPSERVLASG